MLMNNRAEVTLSHPLSFWCFNVKIPSWWILFFMSYHLRNSPFSKSIHYLSLQSIALQMSALTRRSRENKWKWRAEEFPMRRLSLLETPLTCILSVAECVDSDCKIKACKTILILIKAHTIWFPSFNHTMCLRLWLQDYQKWAAHTWAHLCFELYIQPTLLPRAVWIH